MSVIATTLTAAQKATKAIYAAITQLIAGLILVTVGGVGFGDVTTNQWLVIGLAVVVAGGGVYGLSNKSVS